MRVLLLSHNHTVQEMVALALKEEEGVELVVTQAADQVEPTAYDLVLIDDVSPTYEESVALVQALGVEAIVLLAQAGNTEADQFARVLRKPFLPSEIRETIEARRVELERISPPSAKPSQKKKHKKKKKNKKNSPTEVLNLDEIETIKALLEEEGLEIIHEEELAQKVIDEEHGALDHNEALLEALRTMKPKKIRKLLKGANVRIEISFPKEGK